VLTKMAKSPPARGAAGSASPKSEKTEKKRQVCGQILRQLAEDGHEVVNNPGFAEELQAHFNRLPTRYTAFRLFCNRKWPRES